MVELLSEPLYILAQVMPVTLGVLHAHSLECTV